MEKEEHDANIITIRGIPVSFPKSRKPFAPQLALMSCMLVGIQKRENCLLESPTGTGKTLALLSAALAWQRQQKEAGTVMESDSDSDSEEGDKPIMDLGEDKPLRSFADFRYVESAEAVPPGSCSKGVPKVKAPVELAYENTVGSVNDGAARKEVRNLCLDDDDDAFESPKKKRPKKRPKKRGDAAPDTNEGGKTSAESAGKVAKPVFTSAVSPMVRDQPSQGSLVLPTPAMETAFGCTSPPPADVKPSASAKLATRELEAKGTTKTVKKKRKRAPRVFFCSRTHSQLNQVVAELRTCEDAFGSTSAVGIGDDGKPFSMSLLASRRSTCINKTACNDPKGVDDACKRLQKDSACFYRRRSKWNQAQLPPVWDVEEAVRIGKENRLCPYYTARDELPTADLILCPYNYLIDPGVREIMGINLKDAVVIFDEAHNLEDSAREAASAKLSLRALSSAAVEMGRLGAKSVSLAPAYTSLREVIVGVKDFLEEKAERLTVDTYEKAFKVFNGTEALGLMQSRAGVTPESLAHLKQALNSVVNEEPDVDPLANDQEDRNERSSEEVGEDVLSSGAIHVTSSLVKVLGFLLTEGMENVEHYKMVVLRERAPWQPAAATRGRGRRSSGGSRGGMSGGGYGVGGAVGAMEAYLCFWCQSAGVCFSEIDKQVHSVILTSGTLSPLDSFAGELGIDFPHRLEAPHVINITKQCLVTAVGSFGGVSLDARYANQQDLKYQDALGAALLQYAHLVPGGMLVFFPSYGLMDKMHERWKVTGLLKALEEVKAVHLEPRGQGKIEIVLAEYYEAIKAARGPGGDDDDDEFNLEPSKRSPSKSPRSSRTGAVMLAVARGKVSEGIDFSDDAARMCVIIGIPYPSSKDLQITLKKEYQNQRRQRNARLVGGGAWYSLQAFRAVNQAIGRCIRHRNDFGAIVLCDPRYSSQSDTTASLSKWVRSSVKQCRTVEASLPQVNAFFRQHQPRLHDGEVSTTPAKPLVGLPPHANECCGSGNGGAAGGCSGLGAAAVGGHNGGRQDPDGEVLALEAENAAASASSGAGLVQQTLWQVLGNVSEATSSSDDSPVNPTENGEAVSTGEGPIGRTALGSLRQTQARVVTAPITNVANPYAPRTPDARPAPAPKRRGTGFFSSNVECTGEALASEPAAKTTATQACLRPRLVTVAGNCHLHRVSTISLDAGEANPVSNEARSVFGKKSVFLEAPRHWAQGKHVVEGYGRWVANDGLVYAPLFCACTGCRSAHVGEKAVGAGLGGEHLIGHAWFFTTRVETNGVDNSASPVMLTLPAHVAMCDPPGPSHLT